MSYPDYPGYGPNRVAGQGGGNARSGTGEGNDPTLQLGQYPPTAPDDTIIFGGPLPTGTGAPGTAGGGGETDPTVEAGQLVDGLTGLTPEHISDTGAPGTGGATYQPGGGDQVDFTAAGSYLTGTYRSETVSDDIDGPDDWTQANDSGYATGGPKLPGMAEPRAGQGPFQPGGGRVLRGGRAVRG